ncbi:MAG TPA: hypothetical protein VNC39_02410 [Acidocella sp.]|jgi:hypothetical protein|uniref:hypothetical protein n=1 Tax=Acidocella sp. TaxID=50710 RepID=UPI002B98F482|nr:hypothetical protein [Acidocella sp.]HVE20802.1 hypothetical protein [Acidocella sp.]
MNSDVGPRAPLANRLQEKASFCEQKEAKKLYLSWTMGVVADTAHAQHNKSFCGAFFKKRPAYLP